MSRIYNKIGNGFTILELLIVIFIISILASIAYVYFYDATLRADDRRKLSEVRQAVIALELYYDVYGYYPTPAQTVNGFIPYYLYVACLKLDTKDQCVFRNNSFSDSAFNNAINPYLQAPFGKAMPVYVIYPNSNYYQTQGKASDVGGIEYGCTPVAPGGEPSLVSGRCKSYIITWVYHHGNVGCPGGGTRQTAVNSIGYQSTNTTCTYTNNDDFADAYWNHTSLPAPEY